MLTEIQGNFQKNKFMCQPHYMIYNTNNFMDNFLTFNADTIVGITPTIISGIMTFFFTIKYSLQNGHRIMIRIYIYDHIYHL